MKRFQKKRGISGQAGENGAVGVCGGFRAEWGHDAASCPHLPRICRAWAILALLAACLIAVSVMAPTARADDRKTRVVTFLSSGLKTAATAQSSGFDVSAYTEGQIFIDVTVEAATSTLDITIQTSPDNVTWYTHTTVGQITAIGQTRAVVTNFGTYMRINYIVGGTSFTFSVTGVFKN